MCFKFSESTLYLDFKVQTESDGNIYFLTTGSDLYMKGKDSEKEKIANKSEELKGNPNSNEVLRFVKKVEHYISRYGVESILEYAPQDKMNFLRKYIEEKRIEEQSNISVPNVKTITAIKQSTNTRQDILRRQDNLRENNIITGEER